MDIVEVVEKVKFAIRTTSKNELLDAEVQSVIESCKEDLKQTGIVNVSEEDPLILRAIITYARADYDFEGKGDKYKESYNLQRAKLSVLTKYNQENEEG